MGETPYRNAARRYRRARRRLKDDRRGVVAVIGTLLALLVFFTLFGVFITQYLPLWMLENESAFAAQADLAFANFKSTVDSQYQLGGPQTAGVPFPLASGSVPLLSQPTQATLEFLPSGCAKGFNLTAGPHLGQPVNTSACIFVNQTLSQGPGGSGYFTQKMTTGVLQMVLPNRYYIPETYYFEDDAVIDSQPAGYQVMTVNPPFNITRAAVGNTTVSTTMLDLYGNASAVVGTGSQEVYTHYRYSQVVTSSGAQGPVNHTNLPFNFQFEIGTQFPCAWQSFLLQAVQNSGIGAHNATFTYTPSTWTPTAANCYNPNGVTTIITLVLTNINYVQYYYAGVQVSTGVGGT